MRNGQRTTSTDPDAAVTERLRRLREAVRDVPDEGPSKISEEDVSTLRRAGMDKLAEVAEIYVPKIERTERLA